MPEFGLNDAESFLSPEAYERLRVLADKTGLNYHAVGKLFFAEIKRLNLSAAEVAQASAAVMHRFSVMSGERASVFQALEEMGQHIEAPPPPPQPLLNAEETEKLDALSAQIVPLYIELAELYEEALRRRQESGGEVAPDTQQFIAMLGAMKERLQTSGAAGVFFAPGVF